MGRARDEPAPECAAADDDRDAREHAVPARSACRRRRAHPGRRPDRSRQVGAPVPARPAVPPLHRRPGDPVRPRPVRARRHARHGRSQHRARPRRDAVAAAARPHRRARRDRLRPAVGDGAAHQRGREGHARREGRGVDGAAEPGLGAQAGAHAHRPRRPHPVECAGGGAGALHAGRCLRPAPRRRGRGAGQGRRAACRDGRADAAQGAGPAGAHLPVPPPRGALRRPADAPDPRRGLDLPRRRAVRGPHPRVAEDAAQEERGGGVRHAVARRHRALDHRAGADRELPDAHLPAQRPGAGAAGQGRLRALRTQCAPDRDPRHGGAEARLLRPDGARQPPVRAGPRSRGAGLVRRLDARRPQAHRPLPCGRRQGRLRGPVPGGQGPRLGRGADRAPAGPRRPRSDVSARIHPNRSGTGCACGDPSSLDARPPAPKAAARTSARTGVPPLPGLPGGPPMAERLSPFRVVAGKAKRSGR